MGTSGAYGGSGGRDGKAVRDAVAGHLDTIPGSGGAGAADDDRPTLDPNDLRRIINLIRPRSTGGAGGDGPSGGGGRAGSRGGGTGGRTGGGPQRSAATSARSAGRAAAAAYAYRTGDTATLARLGLDYGALQALGDDFEVLRRIVDMACGVSDSTIEDHEQRRVAANVGDWILEQEADGYVPSPEEIVRRSISEIIAETLLVETGDLINQNAMADVAEQDIRDAAEALAAQANLSVGGATEDEISRAVEAGLETIRAIVGGGS